MTIRRLLMITNCKRGLHRVFVLLDIIVQAMGIVGSVRLDITGMLLENGAQAVVVSALLVIIAQNNQPPTNSINVVVHDIFVLKDHQYHRKYITDTIQYLEV